MNKQVRIVLVVIVLALLVFVLARLASSGQRDIGPIENIHGIAFPKQTDGPVIITEKLAHADIFLREPVVGKKLKLTVTFDPGNLTKLEVGVRENSFWLSYPKNVIFDSTTDPFPPLGDSPFVRGSNTTITRTVEIPLTDKLADHDGSVDLMFFATNPASQTTEDEGVDDKTLWHLDSIAAEVSPALPTWPELKDFIKSTLKQEKPI